MWSPTDPDSFFDLSEPLIILPVNFCPFPIDGSSVAESDPERAEVLIGQFNDVFNKTEYKEVPLTERLAPFMDNIVISSERVKKLLKGLLKL